MTLPEGFRWAPRCHLSKVDDALFIEGEQVACLIDKVGGGWFALLQPPGRTIHEPGITRHCSSFEAGRRGCELWALKHEAGLRARIAEKVANRPRHKGADGLGENGAGSTG